MKANTKDFKWCRYKGLKSPTLVYSPTGIMREFTENGPFYNTYGFKRNGDIIYVHVKDIKVAPYFKPLTDDEIKEFLTPPSEKDKTSTPLSKKRGRPKTEANK
jgi:hypothetical protein